MNYDLKAAIERVRNAPWYKVEGHGFFANNYVSAGIEANDHGKGIEIECNLFAMQKLGSGPTFDVAYAELEAKFVKKAPTIITDGDITAII